MPYIGNQHNVGDHVNNFKVLDDISSHTATFNGSATSVVSVSDNTIRIPEHRFIQGQRVTYTNGGGGNIGGLTSGTAYYVSFDSPNTIRLATSLANANSNTVINLSSVGSGTSHTLNAAFDGINTKFKVTYASGKAARFNNATQLNVAINNVIQRPNLSAASFTEGFAIEDSHKIVFKDAPTVNDIFWGSIIANTIENFDLRDNEVNNFTGNGSTTEFTLSSIPANNESVIVTIDGVLQHPSDSTTARAYTLIDSIIQFTAAPALNAEIQVRHIGFAGASTNDVSGFYGRTGNVALTANDHITTGDLTSRNVNVSGILTASSASFGGNVSIGGTLTYEDVTNIDSVGLITARNGIHVTSGNVGIGTTVSYTTGAASNHKLTVAADDVLGIGRANTDMFYVRREYEAGKYTLQTFNEGNSGNFNLQPFGGEVGIGTKTPATKLHVFHPTANNISLFESGDAFAAIGLSDSNGSVNFLTTLGSLRIGVNGDAGTAGVNGTTAMTVKSNGYVGIGTDNPGQLLHLYSSNPVIRFTDTDYHSSSSSNINGTNGNLYFDTVNSNRDIIIRGGSTEVVRVTGDGKLGIGTNNPTELLHLASDSYFRILLKRSGAAPSEAIFANLGSYTEISNNASGVKFSTGSTPTSVMVVRSGGKVGIGSDSPEKQLVVRTGSGSDSGILVKPNVNYAANQDRAYLMVGTDGFGSGGNNWNNYGFQHRIKSNSSGTARVTIDTNGGEAFCVENGGNIGIGTGDPHTQLTVAADSAQAIVTLKRTNSNGGAGSYGAINFAALDGHSVANMYALGDGDDNGAHLIFKTTSAAASNDTYNAATEERVRITSGGQVRLGNTDITTSSAADDLIIGPNTPAGDHGITIISGTSGVGNIYFSDTDTTGLQNRMGTIAYYHNGNYMRFSTNGNQERLRIDSDGNLIHIVNDQTVSLVDTRNVSNAGTKIAFFGANRYDTDEEFAAIKGLLVSNSGGSGNKQNGGLQFVVGSASHTHAMTQAGRVGIGTGNPQALLHLQGEGGNASGLYFKNGTQDVVRQYFSDGNDNSDFVITYDGTGGAEITLEQTGNVALNESNNGNVYIGTNASLDNARLTIAKSAVGFTTAIALHNSTSGGIGSKIISTRALVLGADYENNSGDSSSYMAFETNASEKVRIASDGNFGIGTDTPLGKLHISSGTSGDCELIIEADEDNNNENDNPRIIFRQDGGSNQAAIEQLNNELTISNSVSTNGGIVFKTGTTSPYTNATEKLRIHSNGNVMIGSGTPSTQLHVQNSSSVVRVESTSTSTSARVEITGASNSYSGLHFGDTSDVDNGYIRYYNADNYFIIGTAANERVRIYDDGRVNIGGTNEVQLTASNEAILYLHGAIVGANLDVIYGQRIILDDDDTGTTTADRERGSIYAQFNGNASGGDTSDETRAWNIYSDLNINADYDNGYGVYADVRANFTSGTSTTLRGVYGLCQTQSSGQITEMVGVYGISQTTSGASSVTINDLVGVKGRANMCAGNSTATVTDLVGVWGNIDNDNNTQQATGGKCALFYGAYDKTNGLHNPQGIRIDTSVPNYFRGAIAINGGGNFLPTGNNAIHIKNNTNATGIFLEQTGDQYNVIKGSANRSGSDNAIIDIQGYWNTTQVGRIRIDTGADTSNKDDGRIQFFTASGGSLNEVMQIQENGEIAMDSAGSPSDALANLHVQNETFRVSNHSQTGSYIHLRAWESGDDPDRATIMQMANNVPKFNVTNRGQVFGASTFYAGRARTDANSPTNYYAHGAHGFYAYSARTDDTSAARSYVYIRAWDQGDHGDRSIIQYSDSGSDTDSVNSTSDIRFVVKADGRVQGKGGSFFAGRVEHDAATPSDYFQNGERGFQAYGNDETDETYILARNVADNQNVFYTEVNGEPNAKIQADGDAFTDGTWSNDNADYAEMFEWSDGNTLNEERRGMTVVLDGDKIRLATDSDNKDNIIGVVSVNPVVLGDSAPLGWHGRYKKDVFGSPVRKAHEFLVWNRGYREVDGVSVLFKQPDPNDPRSYSKCERCPVEEIDERKAKGEIPDYAIENNIRITTYAKEIDTETYDSTKKYIPRLDRKEWDAIGLVGKLIIKRGQPIGSRWILMKSNIGTDPNDSSIILDKYLVR